MKREVTLKEALDSWGQWKRREREAAVWDVALPKAAATGFEGLMSLFTEGGKYRLTLRENLDDPQKGLITVEVSKPYREQLEGRDILLANKRGDVLLKGKIVSGRVAQKVERIREIDLKELFVRPKRIG
ncbi:hypothetical protein KJ693_10290 [bacterium]|nr:hypothetical protein [bacterium]MBU1615678.1 hypothetical protein [bacterium]